MRNVRGEQVAQADNADPFASPLWRSPVYRAPEPVIWLVQLVRQVARVVWFAARLIGAHQGGEVCVCDLTTAFDLTSRSSAIT